MRRRYISAAAWHLPRRDRDQHLVGGIPGAGLVGSAVSAGFLIGTADRDAHGAAGVMLLRDGIERRGRPARSHARRVPFVVCGGDMNDLE